MMTHRLTDEVKTVEMMKMLVARINYGYSVNCSKDDTDWLLSGLIYLCTNAVCA